MDVQATASYIDRLNIYMRKRLTSHAPGDSVSTGAIPRKSPYEFSLLPIILDILEMLAPVKDGFLVKSQMALFKEHPDPYSEESRGRRSSYGHVILGPDESFRPLPLRPDFGICKADPDGSLENDKLLFLVEVKRDATTMDFATLQIERYMKSALHNNMIQKDQLLYGLVIHGLDHVVMYSCRNTFPWDIKAVGTYSLVYDSPPPPTDDKRRTNKLFYDLEYILKKERITNGGLFLPRRIENLKAKPASYEYVYSYIFLACLTEQLGDDRYANIRPETVFRPTHKTGQLSWDSMERPVQARPMEDWEESQIPDYILAYSETETTDTVKMVVEIKKPDNMADAEEQLKGYLKELHTSDCKRADTVCGLAISGLQVQYFWLTRNIRTAPAPIVWMGNFEVGSEGFRTFISTFRTS